MPFTAQDIDKIMRGEKTVGNFIGNIRKKTPTIPSGLPPVSTPISAPKPALRPAPSPVIGTAPYAAKLSAPRLNPLINATGATTNAAGMTIPKYNKPVNPDAELTPQEILKKYQAIAGDTKIHDRDLLIKQGQKSLNNIARQQVTLPFLRPKINGIVNEDEIAQAIKLRDELARQSKGGAAALSFMNAASFGQLKNPVLGDKFAPEAVAEQRAAIQRAEQAQPVASAVGSFAGEAVKYGATAGIVNGIPAVQALGKGKLPARLLAGRLTDIVPDAVTAAQETDNAADFAKNLSWEQVKGLAFDGALEAVGAGAKWIVGKIKSKQPVSTMEVNQLRSAIADGVRKGDVDASAVKKAAQPKVPEIPKAKNAMPIAETPTYGKNSVGTPESAFPRRQEVSKVRSNTIENSPMFNMADRELLDETHFKYDVVGEKQSIAEARQRLQVDFDGEVKDLFKKDRFDGTDVDTAMGILEQYKQAARGKPKDSPEALRMINWIKQIQEKGTEAGQRIQAYAKYSRTPEGAAVKAQDAVSKAWDKFAKKDPKLATAMDDLADNLEKIAKEYQYDLPADPVEAAKKLRKAVNDLIGDNKKFNKFGDEFKERILKALKDSRAGKDPYMDILKEFENVPVLTNDDIINVMDIMAKAEKLPEFSRARTAIENQAYKIVADKFNSSFMDKWTKWRYMAMLTNPTTHIRNTVGNFVFGGVTRIKNDVAAVIESAVDKSNKALGGEGIDRTKSFLNPFNETDNALLKATKDDYENFQSLVTAGGKYNPARQIEDQKTIFKSKFFEKIRKGNFNVLEAEDNFALKARYSENLARYLKAKGYHPSVLSAKLPKEAQDVVDAGRIYAAQQAQKATFRDQSKFANLISKGSQLNPVAHAVIEGVVPFKKTPINIIKRGFEYSPAGVVKGLAETFVSIKKGSIPASKAIDDIAAGLTGSGIMALGMYLFSQGFLTTSGSNDKKESGFGALRGQQNYSLHLGDKYYSLDWLSPAAMPLFTGAETWKVLTQKGYSPGEIVDAITKIGDPALEMTMLQGLNSTINQAAYSDTNAISAIGLNALSNYATQSVPTIGGKIANAIDPIRRKSFVEQGKNPLNIPMSLQKAQRKVPFLNQKMQPYLDQWGRTQENAGGNFAGRLAYNMLSPGFYSKDKTTPLDSEIENVYEATGNKSVLPSYTPKSFTVDGEKYTLSGDEYTKYSQVRGQTSYKVADGLRNEPRYKSMDNLTKADSIENAYEYANAVAKKSVNPNYDITGWIANAMDAEKKGIPPETYIAIKNTADLNGNGSISQDELIPTLNDSNLSLAQKAYMFKLQNPKSKDNPYDKIQKAGIPEKSYNAYYELLKNVESSKRPNGKTIPNSLERNRRRKLLDAGVPLQEANAYLRTMYK